MEYKIQTVKSAKELFGWISSQQNISRTSEADIPKSVPASIFMS